MVIKTMSFKEVSLMAMVPERECKTPILMVSAAWANWAKVRTHPTIKPIKTGFKWVLARTLLKRLKNDMVILLKFLTYLK